LAKVKKGCPVLANADILLTDALVQIVTNINRDGCKMTAL
jgi:hypothetical protein